MATNISSLLILVIVVISVIISFEVLATLDFDSEVTVFLASMAANSSSLQSLALSSFRISYKYEAVISVICLLFPMSKSQLQDSDTKTCTNASPPIKEVSFTRTFSKNTGFT